MGKFEGERFKVQLKLSKSRLENVLKAQRNTCGGRRREIATLLQQGNEDRARVNVKYLIRDDYMMEALEVLLTSCEDLIQSAGLISREKTLDMDLVMPAKNLIYACGRIEAPELDKVREQLVAKFGNAVLDVSSEVGRAGVDPGLLVKLSIKTPDTKLVTKYLVAIAQIYDVPWKPVEEDLLQTSIPTPMAPVMHVGMPEAPPPYSPDLHNMPTYPNPPNVPLSPLSPQRQETPPSTPTPRSSAAPDFEELTRRFQALKDSNNKN